MQQPQQGFPLHVPAPASRRASRTLSGATITAALTAAASWTGTASKALLTLQNMHKDGRFSRHMTDACVHVQAQIFTQDLAVCAHAGRLLDQDGAPLAQLDDAVPDVLARHVTATSASLEPIMSRHHSNTGESTAAAFPSPIKARIKQTDHMAVMSQGSCY